MSRRQPTSSPIDELFAAYARLERVLRRHVRDLSDSDLRSAEQLHLKLDEEILRREDQRRATPTTARAPGFYWIRSSGPKPLCQVAEYERGRWYVPGSEDYFYDDASLGFEVVSGCLVPPR